MQLVGYETWRAAAELGEVDVIDRAAAELGIQRARQGMDAMYRSRLEEVPDAEYRYLETVARLPQSARTTGQVAHELGAHASEVSAARARLIERGLLRPVGRGAVTIALPGLDTHLNANERR